MWWDDWNALLQIVIKAVLGFAALVFLLRVAGKRAITKLNAFDLVLVFTVGSILATTILNSDTSLSEGVLALGTLILLQWFTALLSVRWKPIRTIIKSTPTLLVYDGQMLHPNMRRERIAEVEVLAVLRQQGVTDLAQVAAMVLETEGEISLLKKDSGSASQPPAIPGIPVPGDGRS